MAEYFEMGGYAAFVWPAYGLAALFMLAMLIASLRAVRHRETLLAALERQGPLRRGRPADQAPPPQTTHPPAQEEGAQ